MNEKKTDLTIDNAQNSPIGWWIKWGRPYVFSVIWLCFVVLFAYLSIVIDFFVSDGTKTFFESYSKFQDNGWACLGNCGFLFFAGLDYWQTHHHYKNNELQTFVVIFSIASIVLTILLPIAVSYISQQNGVMCILGKEYSVVWACYVMHSVYLVSLLLLRGETRKVRSIEEYSSKYKTDIYKK